MVNPLEGTFMGGSVDKFGSAFDVKFGSKVVKRSTEAELKGQVVKKVL